MSQEEIYNVIDRYLAAQQDRLLRDVGLFEQKLYTSVIDKFASRLISDNGVITQNGDNLQLTTAIDLIFQEFKQNEQRKFLDGFIETTKDITNLNKEYFDLFHLVSRKSFEQISNEVEGFMRQTLGISTSGSLSKGGFLDNFVKDDTLRNQTKEYAVNAVKGGMPLSDFTEGIRFYLVGNPGVDSEVSKHYKTFAYDTYQQYDRTVGQVYANKLDLRYFVYTGGLIDTSRAFCIDKNGKVFTSAEAELWRSDPLLPKDKGNKVINYNPTIDMGRWRCRHRPRWISYELAVKMRPELAVPGAVPGGNEPQNTEANQLIKKAERGVTEVDQRARQIASQNDGIVTPTVIKAKSSLLRKANNDYQGQVSLVKDAVRNTIVVQGAKIKKVIADFMKLKNTNGQDTVQRVKEQKLGDDPLGYSGTIINIKTNDNIIGEVQVNTPAMIYGKQSANSAKRILGEKVYNEINKITGLPPGLGHKFYEEWRVLDRNNPADLEKMVEIETKSKKYYSDIRKADSKISL